MGADVLTVGSVVQQGRGRGGPGPGRNLLGGGSLLKINF